MCPIFEGLSTKEAVAINIQPIKLAQKLWVNYYGTNQLAILQCFALTTYQMMLAMLALGSVWRALLSHKAMDYYSIHLQAAVRC